MVCNRCMYDDFFKIEHKYISISSMCMMLYHVKEMRNIEEDFFLELLGLYCMYIKLSN